MTNPEKFINWLEGYLDASKNNLSTNQIKEIRKKITELTKYSADKVVPIWDSNVSDATHYPVFNNPIYSTPVNEEYLKEIERNKNASTMEELV